MRVTGTTVIPLSGPESALPTAGNAAFEGPNYTHQHQHTYLPQPKPLNTALLRKTYIHIC